MFTTRRAPFLATAAVAGLSALAAACGSSGTKTSTPPSSTSPPTTAAPYTAPAPSPTTSPPATGAAALKVGALPAFATALTDSSGRAVYLFEADTGTASTCTGACATAWPPVTTSGTPSITGGDAGKVGTIMRSDGTMQVTYGGHPLYYFAQDAKAGETHGQAVTAFGAGWYLVGSNGSKIDMS